jgi:hypothetical protein
VLPRREDPLGQRPGQQAGHLGADVAPLARAEGLDEGLPFGALEHLRVAAAVGLRAPSLISQRSSWRGSTSSAFTHRPHRSEQVRPLLLGVRHSVAPSGATATRVTATPPSANTTAWPASWKQVARRSTRLKACMAQPYR